MAGAPQPRPRSVAVAFGRLPGWVARFEERHPETRWTVEAERVTGASGDGTTVLLVPPIEPLSESTMAGLMAHIERPWPVGVVLVRRGGFAVARLAGAEIAESKVGQRHVQGRTKAGGWSQQRFARRRDNQARAAFDAAADHVARLLVPYATTLRQLAVGGDRQGVEVVLDRPSLAALVDVPRRWLGAVPDPSRAVLLDAVSAARSVTIEITDPA